MKATIYDRVNLLSVGKNGDILDIIIFTDLFPTVYLKFITLSKFFFCIFQGMQKNPFLLVCIVSAPTMASRTLAKFGASHP